jgi:pimeloyl-ACP methyl ester carboxylesterase
MSPNSPFDAALAKIPTLPLQVVVSGVSTAYWVYEPAGATRTIVMVHGFRGDHHGLEPLVAEMPEPVRVIIPDLPGFGASSDFDGPATIDMYAEWLIAFVSVVAPERDTFVVGHSFGSIVVAAAIAAGLSSRSVALINPIAANALKGPRGIMTRLAVFYYQLAAWLPEKLGFALLRNSVIVRIMSVTMAKTKNPDLRAWIHDQHDRYFSHFNTREGVLSAFRTSVGTDVSMYVEALTLPLLLIVAERDDITALPQQMQLHERLPQSEIVVVPDVGHLVHYEAPDFAATAISRFMVDH